jgi:hypothetical protein
MIQMSKTDNYPDMLWNQLQEYIIAWNKEAKRQEVSNVYTLEVLDGDKPLQAGGSIIKNYKTLQLKVDTTDGSFILYIAHAPLKDITEASRSKHWLLQLMKDLMYQMFTNYTIMSHMRIIEQEKQKEVKTKQIGSLVTPDGKPLMSVVKE